MELLAFLIGACLGSFVTLASWRLPRGEDIVRTPSRCAACKTPLKIPQLFPLLSWLIQRAKCAACKAPIHWRYPVIELVSGLLAVIVWQRFGVTPEAAMVLVLTTLLLVMIVVDFEHYLIPDTVHAVLLPLALLYHYTVGADWVDIAAGTLTGVLVALALHYGYRFLRKKEGLGFGDVKFFAVAGAWLGLHTLVPFFFFAGVLGIATALLWRALNRGALFPFGPALAASVWICVVFPEIPEAFWQLQRGIYG